MPRQYDSSLIATDAEHDRHYGSERLCCGHCCRMFSVDDDDSSEWLCPSCREVQDAAFPPNDQDRTRESKTLP